MRDGTVTIDGAPGSADDLAPKLKELAAAKGTVYYYRESGQEEPHPNAMKVIAAVIEHQLPISLSSKPDFSDYIGEDGQSHKR